jgi:dTDP-3,4-didehydro-2,6-dideoxy-alpha-D-glucose 3-reductase
MTKLRIGVMGCASIAVRAMMPAMQGCQEVEIIAVASRTKDKAEKTARMFDCDAIKGYERLLERDDIDAVYMPLPTGLHEEWVIKTLEAGKHILVEKSFAENYQSARRMLKLAKAKKLLVMENYLFPQHSQYAWVKDLIASGDLGHIHLFRSTFGFPPLPMNNFRYSRELGGGALLDAGGYVLKASQLFLGNDLKLLCSSLNYEDPSDVDIYGDAMLRNSVGQVAQVSFGFNYYYQCCFEFLGSRGKLIVERAYTPPPGFMPKVYLEYQDLKKEIILTDDNYYINMCSLFAQTVQSPDDYTIHWNAGLNQARLIDAVRKGDST